MKNRLQKNTIDLFSTHYLVYRSLNNCLESIINTISRGKVLDIGCGNKPYENLFVSNLCQYIGCDIEQSSENKVDVICSSTDLKFKDEEFDMVFSTQVIEHVFDHNLMLTEACRVLKKSGILVLSGPMYWPLHEEPYDFFRFTKYGILSLLEKNGFEEFEFIPNGGAVAQIGQSIVLYLNRKGNSKRSKLKYLVYRLLFIKIWINLFCSVLDRISSTPKDWSTLNFVVTAKKK